MKPNCTGIYEWHDSNGKKRLVVVVDVRASPNCLPYLRVYWWGGYYNVNDDPQEGLGSPFGKAEWPDSWGNRVADISDIADDQLYLFPDEEDLEKFGL